MPWGCLCSKEKKRPQISSPILKPDESGKHQLLPAVRRPLLGVAPEKLEQRLLDPNLNELNDRSSTEANGDESSEEYPNGNGPKRDKLQQQLIQKSKLKSSNLKSTTYTRNTENDKLTRHLNNVKFAFDEPQPPQTASLAVKPTIPAKTAHPEELIKLDDEAGSKRGEDQVDQNGNGNYDVLPPAPHPPPEVILQIVENSDENSNLHLQPPAAAPPDVVKSSTESIPYIDDEQAQVLRSLNSDPNKVRNFHDARIITLTPKNVGSQAEKIRGPSSPELRQLVQAKVLQQTDGPDVTQIRFTHSFHILASGCCDRICQHCHLVLSLDVALRCAVCEFTCHQRCVQLQQKNAHEDEQQHLQQQQQQQQQQIINSKYNSFPAQQQQTRHQTTNLNHVNNNSIPNGGSHYQQHNYSSQVHQYHQQQQQQSPGLYHSIESYQDRGSTAATSLRLSYVTERILASILPARRAIRNGTTTPVPGFADEHERELIEMLEQKHEKNYRIFDLESCIASISLEKLCELCKHIDSWLGSGKEKIVVLQDREDKQRLGTAIAAYLEYQKICGSNFPQSNRTKALQTPGSPADRRTPTWLDLDIYSTQKFLESITGPLRIPSHKRYIKYFSGLLSGTIKMNAASLFLRAIIVESPPCLHYRSVTVNSEWRSFVKIYEGVRCLFTSDIYVIPITTRQFIYEIKHPLRLRGDILIRCYQIIPNNNKLHDEKELISCVQFHTCAITEREVQFAKVELDLACNDERFPADHKVRLCFDTTPNERSAILVFQNPLVRIEPIIEGGDHLETINEDESSHTHGPLDGSLYATILKSPKSPTGSSSGGGQTLISPPAEFSNGKPIANGHHHHPVPPVTPPPRSSSALSSASYSIYESAKRGYQSPAAVNGSTYQQQQQQQSQGGSRGPVVGGESANISHSESSGNIVVSSSGSYRNVIENGGSGATYDQNQNLVNQSQSQQQQQQQQQQTQIRSQADGRESVRSPLTLSMDSGISSSGPVNRRLQGSSVSPSSFPSQASPQDDRHRELDDLLSDMLMTVQGIPDVGRSKGASASTPTTTTTTQPMSSTQATHHHHHHHHHHLHQQQQQGSDHFINTSTDTIKRSHSAQLPALRESAKERELLLYETSSTTTTLTPPPSESGRETPLLSSAYSTIRDKRDLCLTPTERELLMNLQQHQSFGYPRQARSTTGASERFTSDDDDDHYGNRQIPYHAREDSRPFTYGSIPLTGTPQNPPASTMLKMQSGLSSPSMVRKALGTPTSARKSTGLGGGTSSGGGGPYGGRNSEFEEMLRERREKVFSEKYTIGDQSPRGTDTVDNRWNYSTTIRTTVEQPQLGGGDTNGYPHPHEPLKRSNTMDGSFGRQFSNDGISGQTWLQLQQQKLRARKEQQKREHSNSFSYSYGSPAFPTNASDTLYNTTHRRSQTLSPVRNERSYHTLTTTHTRTNSTERPFVAVKRAHENAKMQTIGSAPLSVLNASPHGHIAQAQQQSPPQTLAATAPSPSLSVASTTVVSVEQQHQQHGSSSNASSSSPINNGHHSHHHQHHQHQHDQQQHHVSFDSSVVSQNGLLSLADQDHSTPKHGHVRLAREESFSSYRSETEPDNSPAGGSPRPETPAFPVTPRTPYGLSNGSSSPALPPKSPTSQRKYNSTWSLRSQKSTVSTYDMSKDLFAGSQQRSQQELINQSDTVSCYTSRRNSTTSNATSEPQEVAPQFVKFARDSSKYWYKPNISREEAIALLRNAPPGTFVVRDSTTFANAYGLVVKVAHPPPGVQSKGPNSEELVRHFLVEPTIRGVRLKGSPNEPVFTSLSALVYQHSITPLVLPCRLIIPDTDLQQTDFHSPAQQQLLMQGAACNVLYLFTCDTESLTGPQAIRKAVGLLLSLRPLPKPTQVHFKVSIQGITLTDNTRQLFFRRHYPSNNVSFCSLDPDEHRWSIPSTTGDIPSNKRIFAFVAKRSPTSADNQCHVFCELETTQPASAIVSFANKVVLGGTGGQQPAPARAI